MSRKSATSSTRPPFDLQFDIGTVKHLGIQMYSSMPPVIGELVSNAWDADATHVKIDIPEGPLNSSSEITVRDDGTGMSDHEVRDAYLVIGRDRRQSSGEETTLILKRPVMGRKGIGKFSSFGIAGEVEVETVKNKEHSRFVMNLGSLRDQTGKTHVALPALVPTGKVDKGTLITLRQINKYKNRSIQIIGLRRGLARRFSIIGQQFDFTVEINGLPITSDERDIIRLLDKRPDGRPFLWEYKDVEIQPDTGWRVSGWIGALKRTDGSADGVQRGISLMARGKMVQEPFVFDAVVGQQFALSYLVGELTVEFVDATEDMIATTRNSLVWETEPNEALKNWGKQELNRIAREWAEWRSEANVAKIVVNPTYKRFQDETASIEDSGTKRIAEKLIMEVVKKNPLADETEHEPLIEVCRAFLEFDAFRDVAVRMTESDMNDVPKIVQLFRDWELIEAKEMMNVTQGRITTIEKLQKLIDSNALEVPVLHNFLKEFPWVLDPRWTLIAEELHYSQILAKEFPEEAETLESDRRIDFLCVKESRDLVIVEIKRPHSKASNKELTQIEDYVIFMRNYVGKTTDPDHKLNNVIGILLVGNIVDTVPVAGRVENLHKAGIYVRKYHDLLSMVENIHKEFLDKYKRLRNASSTKALPS